ncbi:hypothetical protein [Lysinibacillus sphaericus]|uniref:hypothetical protein n=1 Tax=Lysinibacillus sphaericus TaxID=1421 RepID=UPI0018CDD496|nr:hypothetical protein [Lysinibacillus sphaericus]
MEDLPKNKTYTQVKAGAKPRDDLYLKFYYPAVDPFREDSWVKVLGPKTFVYWLQLLTMVDRSPAGYDKYGNAQTVPRSLEGLAKLFGISRPTFYSQVIKPLWNYGLIDLEEWQEQKKIGTKALNIIVYEYPMNQFEYQNRPLQKVRDYDTEYHSYAKSYGHRAKTYFQNISDVGEGSVAATRTEQQELDLNNTSRLREEHITLIDYLQNLGIRQNILDEIAEKLLNYNEYIFTLEDAEKQLKHMQFLIDSNKPIYNFPEYFVQGLIIHKDVGDSLNTSVNRIPKPSEPTRQAPVPFYNWLEERN